MTVERVLLAIPVVALTELSRCCHPPPSPTHNHLSSTLRNVKTTDNVHINIIEALFPITIKEEKQKYYIF